MQTQVMPDNSAVNKNTDESSIQDIKEQLIDIGRLIDSTGRAFFSYPNLSYGQNDFFQPQLAHRLILSRITKSEV